MRQLRRDCRCWHRARANCSGSFRGIAIVPLASGGMAGHFSLFSSLPLLATTSHFALSFELSAMNILPLSRHAIVDRALRSLVSGCASIISGRTATVKIDSNPSNAAGRDSRQARQGSAHDAHAGDRRAAAEGQIHLAGEVHGDDREAGLQDRRPCRSIRRSIRGCSATWCSAA